MKKLAFFTLFIYLWCMIIPVSASSELLENGSFEKGLTGYFYAENGGQYLYTSNAAASGKYSVYLSKRTSQDICIQYDIKQILKQHGPQYYTFSISAKLNEPAFDYSKFRAVIKIVTTDQEFLYKSQEEKIVNEKFTSCKSSTNLLWQGEITEAYLYLQNCTKNEYPNIFIDDFSLSFSIVDVPSSTDTPTFSSIQIGAIRRDIWEDSSVESKAAASELWPERYRMLFPFHTALGEEIHFGLYQDIIDIEIDFAEYAGIDFWAYYWLENGGAYRAHKKSSKASSVKMCFILEQTTSLQQIKEMAEYFSLDCYLKLSQRPVLFLDGDTNTYNKLDMLSQVCALKGIQLPYIILMTPSYLQSSAEGIDAIVPTGDSITESDWKEAFSYTKELIPMVYCGKNKADYCTADEIISTLKTALDFCKNTNPGCILLNAWNRNEAGAWLVPTLSFNASGNAIIENGKYRLDTSRIEALHNLLNPNGETDILHHYSAYSLQEPQDNRTPAVTEKPQPSGNEAGNNIEKETAENILVSPQITASEEIVVATPEGFMRPVWISLIAVFVVLVAVILFVLWKRKKNHEKESGNHGS